MRNRAFRFSAVPVKWLLVPLTTLLMLSLAAFDTAPKDQGIGGTGAIFRGDDQGLTGTGYFGTISDFGSIIINGREVDLGDAIIVRIDGAPAQVSDLKIGHVIAARSYVTDAHEQIQTVDVLHTVIGLLETLDPATGLGVVLGQTIDFNSRIGRETFATGDWIAVSGLRAQSGVIVASRVEKMASESFLVRGDAAQIKVAFAALNITSQSIPSGSSLVLSGRMVAGRAQIDAVRRSPLIKLLSGTKTILVETYLPATVAAQDRSVVTLLGEKLFLKNKIAAGIPKMQTRQVLEGVNRNGRLLVTRTATAPFDDHPSRASIKQTSLEGASKIRSGAGQSSSSSPAADASESDGSSDSQSTEGETGAGQNGKGGGSSSGGDKGSGDKGGDKSEKD